MNPDNQTPDNQPQTPPSNETQPAPVTVSAKSSKRKWLWLAIVVVVLLIAGAVVWAVTKSDKKDSNAPPSTGQTSNNPNHIDGIAVGPYRYANACDVFPYNDEYATFGGIALTANFQSKYAEDGLAVKDIPRGGVLSTCSREFGDDTVYADTTVVLSIYQYATAKQAQTDFDYHGLTQSQLKAGQQQASDDPSITALSGAANTLYNAGNTTSYTIIDNKIIQFSALLSSHTPETTFKQSVVKALPGVLKNIADPKFYQGTVEDPDFGKKIGDATYFMPCKLFTADDYKKMTGTEADPSEIDFKYTYARLSHPAVNQFEGAADMSCTRQTSPAVPSKDRVYVALQVQYFKSAADASNQIKQHYGELSTKSDFKAQVVSGVGDYAMYVTSGDAPAYMDVQKGPYILDFVIPNTSDNKPAPVNEFTKAANVLLPKLP